MKTPFFFLLLAGCFYAKSCARPALDTTATISSSNTIRTTTATTICACQPSSYEITFAFDIDCEDEAVAALISEYDDQPPGILQAKCRVSAHSTVIDRVPAYVEAVQFYVLGEHLDVIAYQSITGTFTNGDTVRYDSPESLYYDQEGIIDNMLWPRGLHVSVLARNAMDEQLHVTWAIVFDNEACDVFPILSKGQRQAWSIITDLVDPPEAVCPALATSEFSFTQQQQQQQQQVSPPSSAAPSTVPSNTPSTAPSVTAPSDSYHHQFKYNGRYSYYEKAGSITSKSSKMSSMKKSSSSSGKMSGMKSNSFMSKKSMKSKSGKGMMGPPSSSKSKSM